ncbi:unnamed protein product [Toxocara canis]|uniref:RRM domain-containing protein n=1 Tax=Toxocara canis TaxID=6265 RepID=A0A183USR3_TOXCA|nr:unnamed protein product [Toxocara canis]
MSNKSSERILISGLAPDTTHYMVERYFSQLGTLTECVVMVDRESGNCRGYAFVNFVEKSAVDECLRMQYHFIDNVKVQLRLINSTEDNSILAKVPVKKILISFVGKDLSMRHIHDYFSNFGNVKVDCGGNDEKYEYFAYVLFDDEFACRTCLAIGEHSIAGQVVDVRAVVRKEDLMKAEQADRERAEREAQEIAAKAELEERQSTRADSRPPVSTACYSQQQAYDSTGAHQSWSQSCVGTSKQHEWPAVSSDASLPLTTVSYGTLMAPLFPTGPLPVYTGNGNVGHQLPVAGIAPSYIASSPLLTQSTLQPTTSAYMPQMQPTASVPQCSLPSNSGSNIPSAHAHTVAQLGEEEPPQKLCAYDGTFASASAGYGCWGRQRHGLISDARLAFDNEASAPLRGQGKNRKQPYWKTRLPTAPAPLPQYNAAT